MNPEVILPAMLREERARDLAPELVKALRGLLEIHIAHHNLPQHASARALLAKIDGEQA